MGAGARLHVERGDLFPRHWQAGTWKCCGGRVSTAAFRNAAAHGLVQACNMIAACYDEGWGVDTNKAQAVTGWRKATDPGDAGA
jgi:hypothetical protein